MKEAKLQLKQAAVADVVDKMKRAQSVVVLDYRGLTVAEVSDLRSKFREVGVEYKVIKNNMLKRAAEELNIEGVDDYFKGPTAVAFGYEDPVAPAKILCKFVKDAKRRRSKAESWMARQWALTRFRTFQSSLPRTSLLQRCWAA